jgi:hypothetical protein
MEEHKYKPKQQKNQTRILIFCFYLNLTFEL